VEGGHPMLHGFLRLKGRLERRSSFLIESQWQYLQRRLNDLWYTVKGIRKLILELEDVWLETRNRQPDNEKIAGFLRERPWRSWRDMTIEELKGLYRECDLSVPSSLKLWLKRVNVFYDEWTVGREPAVSFWKDAKNKIDRHRIFELDLWKIFTFFIQEIVLLSQFIISLSCSDRFQEK